MLENQMLECDDFGNNALHFAFRSKKHVTVDLIIRAGFGDIDHRNQLGLTPKEATHNSVMDSKTKDLLGQFDPTSQKPREPDYLFLASQGRKQVLIDQLDSLGFEETLSENQKREKGAEEPAGWFRQYRYTFEPEEKVLVLVFFNDETLNKEAEDQGLMIQL